jgi:hypothetical protein
VPRFWGHIPPNMALANGPCRKSGAGTCTSSAPTATRCCTRYACHTALRVTGLSKRLCVCHAPHTSPACPPGFASVTQLACHLLLLTVLYAACISPSLPDAVYRTSVMRLACWQCNSAWCAYNMTLCMSVCVCCPWECVDASRTIRLACATQVVEKHVPNTDHLLSSSSATRKLRLASRR